MSSTSTFLAALTRRAPQLYTALSGRLSSSSNPLVSPSRFSSFKPLSTSRIPSAHFSNTSRTATMASPMDFLKACENRRTIYQLTDKIPISDARVEEIAKHNILHVPSSFNSQSTRIVVLLNEEHKKFWEITKECLKPQVPEEQFPQTEKKLDGFKAGHGTILFLNDPNPVKKLQSQFALYAQHFPGWATQSNAMAQYHLWTALEAEGCACNLQHYNPIVDQRVAGEWNFPQEWELQAQLVFGGYAEGAREAVEKGGKQQQPIEERLFIHGSKA